MDFLKMLLKASLMLALMFLGLEAKPNKDNNDKGSKATAFIQQIL